MKKIVHKENVMFMKVILKNLFEKYGYETISADTDEELLEILEKDTIDFVVYDLGNSYYPSIFDKIKEISPDTKTTISTSNTSPHVLFEFHRKGMYPFINKPFSEWEIIDILDHYLPGTRKEIPFVINKEHFSKIEYRGRSNDQERLFFKYNDSNFFVYIDLKDEEITNIEINHNVSLSIFRCSACGENREDSYDDCPSFSVKQEEVLDILFSDEAIKEECTQLISTWERFKLKNHS